MDHRLKGNYRASRAIKLPFELSSAQLLNLILSFGTVFHGRRVKNSSQKEDGRDGLPDPGSPGSQRGRT